MPRNPRSRSLISFLSLIPSLALLAASGALAVPKAFPGAEGFGANATGGRGGSVIYVTTLASTGPGSLQEALDTTGARTILFKVSGVIDGPITLTQGNVTIAGQSSPGGVIVRGLLIQGESTCEQDGCPLPPTTPSNFIVRNLRLRPLGQSDDALRLHRARNGIIDHCSMANADDEAVQISFSSDLTIQNSMLSETLGDHAERGGMLFNYTDPSRGFPLDRVSVHHTIWNRIIGRLPELSRENGSAADTTMQIEISNNLLWDAGYNLVVYEDNTSDDTHNSDPIHYQMNFVGNYAYVRPTFTYGLMQYYPWLNSPNLTTGYFTDNQINIYPTRRDYQLIYCCNDYPNTLTDPGSLQYPDPNTPPDWARSTRHAFPSISYQSSSSLLNSLPGLAGALPHDPMDRRLMNPINARSIDPADRSTNPYADTFDLDFDAQNPPAPPQDSDNDGMPDAWETAHGLSPSQPSNNGTGLSSDGYTNLEVYLAELMGGGTGSTPTPTPAGPTPTRTPTPPAGATPTHTPAAASSLRIYVSGESIERRNRFVEAPFNPDGSLNERGGGDLRNDNEEYGWMIPMRDRLLLRAPSAQIQFVGTDAWLDADDNPYSGTYPSTTAEPSSAISGTDIGSWVTQRQAELQDKTHCYNVAFASRGGNDFGNDNDEDYKAQLKSLILLLANGSNCDPNPKIYITGHMPDDQRGGSGDPPDAQYVAQQLQRFVTRAHDAVNELAAEQPTLRLKFIDVYTPFLNNQPTTAFPSEAWSSGGVPDYAKITRTGDMYHPRRLASIYAGELIADQMDIQGGGSTPTPGGPTPTRTPTDTPAGPTPTDTPTNTPRTPTATRTPTPPPTPILIYVSGESIERRNRFVESPFNQDGSLNERGGGDLRNDNEEYGWMIPMRDRLLLRAPSAQIQFVGTDAWLDADDNPYSGTYPSTTAEPSSAISGTDIGSWVTQRQAELQDKTHCYNVAFASRGGNDFGNDNDEDYKAQLKSLILLLANGSNCDPNPKIYITGHMPDDQRGGSGDPPDAQYVAQQLQRFVTRAHDAVNELAAEQPTLRLKFIDVYTPFLNNQPTTAFPSEAWASGGVPDYAKITRVGDMYHPRRLASIYAGELIADQMDVQGAAVTTDSGGWPAQSLLVLALVLLPGLGLRPKPRQRADALWTPRL